MQNSTTSPSAAVHSTEVDRVASRQNNNTETTVSHTYTIKCPSGCPAVIQYDDHTDWPAISRRLNRHWKVCPCSFHQLPTSHHRYNASNHDQVIASWGKRKKTEDQRKEELERDEYTSGVRPTSVRCRGCHKDISLDKRSRYYSGLWDKHRGKCPGILEIEKEKLARKKRGFCPSNREQRPTAASSFDMSGHVIGFSSSDVRLYSYCWEEEER